MNDTLIMHKLTHLGLTGMKESYQRQSENVSYHELCFNERIYDLLEAQEIYLANKKIKMNLKLSKIKDKQACLEAIEYLPKRMLNKSLLLDLSKMNFLRAFQNIIITGKTGSGKSYLAQALANRAIVEGFRTYYVRVPSLLEEIKLSRVDGTYATMLRKYARFQLLILDDFGISPMSMDDAVNLFEIIEDRTLVSSTIIASQLPVAHWHDYLNHNTIADAILDRVVHSSHRIQLEGGSMRRLKSTIQNKGEN